ncbi:MAG: S-layer homology domain-containing protein, partial [Candidatus Gastranaerophilaceae bacterium]
MTIKRLSLAAAISFSLFATGTAMVQADGVDLQQMTSPDLTQASAATTQATQDSNIVVEKNVSDGTSNIVDVSDQFVPQTAKPVIKHKMAKKAVKKAEAKEMAPVKTGEACPTNAPCPTCPGSQVWPEKPAEPILVSPACPTACPVPTCTDNAGPACAMSQGVPHKPSFCEKQVYAYPAGIYGKPSGFAADPYNMTQGKYCPSCACGPNNFSGLSTARNEYTSNNCGCAGAASTCGAAAPFGGYGLSGLAAPLGSSSCGCGMSEGLAAPGSACGPCGAAPIISSPLDAAGACGSRCGTSVSRDCGPNICPITINSNSSIQAIKKSVVPMEIKTGGAAPLKHPFCDVPADFWAAKIIDRLAASQVIAGYPDQTFKPDNCVTRAEFTSLIVSGLNYQDE